MRALLLIAGLTVAYLLPAQRWAAADPNEGQPQVSPQQALELMKSLCHGVINNSVCIGKDGITVLGPDGKLHAPQPGWQPTFGGPMVFIPDAQHPHP